MNLNSARIELTDPPQVAIRWLVAESVIVLCMAMVLFFAFA